MTRGERTVDPAEAGIQGGSSRLVKQREEKPGFLKKPGFLMPPAILELVGGVNSDRDQTLTQSHSHSLGSALCPQLAQERVDMILHG